MNPREKQHGATLLVSILLLIVLSILVVSAINISSVDLKIVYNMQEQQRFEAVAQEAIERVMSSIENFLNPIGKTYSINSIGVTVTPPECLEARPVPGYSAVWDLSPEQTSWEIVSNTDEDPNTGASATIHQGIGIKLPAGSCP